jgi:hypothetical protein
LSNPGARAVADHDALHLAYKYENLPNALKHGMIDGLVFHGRRVEARDEAEARRLVELRTAIAEFAGAA